MDWGKTGNGTLPPPLRADENRTERVQKQGETNRIATTPTKTVNFDVAKFSSSL